MLVRFAFNPLTRSAANDNAEPFTPRSMRDLLCDGCPAPMLPEDTIEPRATTGVHARAVAPPAPAPAEAPDPIAEGLARALRHLADANAAAVDLAAELDGSFAAGPGAPDACRRATVLLRCVQSDVAGALRDVAGLASRRR